MRWFVFVYLFIGNVSADDFSKRVDALEKVSVHNSTLLESHLDFVTFLTTVVIFIAGSISAITFYKASDIRRKSESELKKISAVRESLEQETEEFIKKSRGLLNSSKDKILNEAETWLSFEYNKMKLKVVLEEVKALPSEEDKNLIFSLLTNIKNDGDYTKKHLLDKIIKINVDEEITTEAKAQLELIVNPKDRKDAA